MVLLSTHNISFGWEITQFLSKLWGLIPVTYIISSFIQFLKLSMMVKIQHFMQINESFNPLYTNGLFRLVWNKKLGRVHCAYIGVKVTILKTILPEDLLYLHSVYIYEMLHFAAFHLGLHCL